jgi:hypothetical protein
MTKLLVCVVVQSSRGLAIPGEPVCALVLPLYNQGMNGIDKWTWFALLLKSHVIFCGVSIRFREMVVKKI